MPIPEPLTLETLHAAARRLAKRDPDLAQVLEAHGPPPLWQREPGFPTLLYIILEQQVSLASARAAYLRLLAAADPVNADPGSANPAALTPERFLQFDDAALKVIGFSRQKTAYGRGLAEAVLAGQLDLPALGALPDGEVRAALTRLKGIGRWSADIYLMEALLRPDIWPTGDLALAIAVRRVKALPETPSPAQLEALGEAYRPYRAAAARLFWHHYLSNPAKKQSAG